MLFDAASSRRLWERSWFGAPFFCCITRHEVARRLVSKSLIVSDWPSAPYRPGPSPVGWSSVVMRIVLQLHRYPIPGRQVARYP